MDYIIIGIGAFLTIGTMFLKRHSDELLSELKAEIFSNPEANDRYNKVSLLKSLKNFILPNHAMWTELANQELTNEQRDCISNYKLANRSFWIAVTVTFVYILTIKLFIFG